MVHEHKLIYGHDPLCGWCYAIIPAFRLFASRYPAVPVEVVGGGLFKGERIRPYDQMRTYITDAFARIEAKTARIANRAFFDMMMAADTGRIVSAPPTHALIQLAGIAPDKQLEFAHVLQEVHFEAGHSFNTAETYHLVTNRLGLETLDTLAILTASESEPLVEASYALSEKLGVTSFPTTIIQDKTGKTKGVIDGVYDPDAFIRAYEAIIADEATV